MELENFRDIMNRILGEGHYVFSDHGLNLFLRLLLPHSLGISVKDRKILEEEFEKCTRAHRHATLGDGYQEDDLAKIEKSVSLIIDEESQRLEWNASDEMSESM
jgi:hypothetical protein